MRLVVWFLKVILKRVKIYACDFCETSVISQGDFEEQIIYACNFCETGGVISQGFHFLFIGPVIVATVIIVFVLLTNSDLFIIYTLR